MTDSQLIAVVDDDPSVRRALGRLLGSAGYCVRLFASGLEAVASPAFGTADCVLLDIHLGDITGFEVCARVRQSGARMPVIFMTARDSEETRARAASYPGSAYLRKPFEASDLLAVIRDTISADPAAGPSAPAPIH